MRVRRSREAVNVIATRAKATLYPYSNHNIARFPAFTLQMSNESPMFLARAYQGIAGR